MKVSVLPVVNFLGQPFVDGIQYFIHMLFPPFLDLLEVFGNEISGLRRRELVFQVYRITKAAS